jgi:hypothetical protein
MALRFVAALALGCGLTALAGCQSGGDDDGDDSPESTVGSPDGGTAGQGSSAGEGGDDGPSAGRAGGAQAEAGNGHDPGSDAGSGADGGGGDGGDEPFEPMPIAELPAAFARAICDALDSCVGAAALRELTEREDCDVRVAKELAATDFHHMADAVSAARVFYDPSELPACLEGVRALGCDVLVDSFPPPCDDVLEGNVEIDGECAISAECAGTAFCAGAASGTCPSTCSELLGAGAECAADNECGDDLLCLGGVCTAPSVGGEPCGGDSGKVCALGFNCADSTDVDVGECTDNASTQVGREGDVCEPGGALCVDGLSCVFDGALGFHCEPYVGEGDACHLGLPGQCPVDQYCDAAAVMDEGVCRDLPGDGDACVLTDLCAPGFVCVLVDDAAVCRPIRDNGGDCDDDRACRSGNCVDGSCEPPPTCDT